MGRGTNGEVLDGSWRSGQGLGKLKKDRVVSGTAGRFGTGLGTLVEVWEGSENPRGVPGRVRGPSGRSRKGRETLGVVRDRSGIPSGRFGTGRVTHGEVWDGSERSGKGLGTLKEDRVGSGVLRGGPGQVWGPSWKSGTGWWILGGIREGSGNPRGGLGKVEEL